MKHTFFLLYISCTVINFCLPSLLSAQNYQLVWSDEFDSTQINTKEWTYEVNGNGGGNNELQYYTARSQNSSMKDGTFKITALKENYLGKAYTSARLHTNTSWQYGKIEARIKMPYGKGIWPAFWMLGSNLNSVGWPKCGEIDIMEMIGGTPTASGGDNKTFGTLHWDDSGHKYSGYNYTIASGKLADAFHNFFIVWDAKKVIWGIDNVQFGVLNTQSAAMNAFRAPFFIIINLAVGGNWPGSPDATTVFPQTLEFDYIRVYQDVVAGVSDQSTFSNDYQLLQNYPNPFNPSTSISYYLPKKSNISLKITNLLGQEVADLAQGEQPSGWHSVEWKAEVPSGMYFYRLQTADADRADDQFIQVRKMMLLK
ncbi:MAG: family 16 glycosylhydrolase [Bacteroidota bacterium]|jgi:beta-glucanase (GH16 family)